MEFLHNTPHINLTTDRISFLIDKNDKSIMSIIVFIIIIVRPKYVTL